MKNLSEKILFAVVVIATAVSVSGVVVTLVSQPVFQGLTGAANTGNLTFSIEQEVSINVTADIVNFGPGRVNSDQTNCTISTADPSDASCGNWTYAATVKNFTVENTGNVKAELYIRSSQNASQWIGGGAGSVPDPWVQFKSFDNETNSCTTAFDWTALDDGDRDVCNGLNFTNTKDSLNVAIRLNIPQDASPGSKETTVIFTATGA